MVILALIGICVVQTLLSTGVLAAALLVTGEEELTMEVLLKCLGITAIAILIGLIPYMGLVGGIVWFGALMVVFEKEFMEALLIAAVCFVINLAIGFGLGLLIASMGWTGAS